MKKVTDAISKTIEERMTNPLVGTFAISWLISNWRPVLFFLFSKKDIESKISYIQEHFSNVTYLVWLPLIAAFFYVLVLPYITLIIEWLVKNATDYGLKNKHKKKMKIMEDENIEAIEMLRLEKNKSDFLKANTTNDTIESQTKTIASLQSEISIMQQDIEKERTQNLERISDINSEHQRRFNSLQNELTRTIDKHNDVFEEMNKYKNELTLKNIEVLGLKSELEEMELKGVSRLYETKDGDKIIEVVLNGIASYYNLTNNTVLNLEQFEGIRDNINTVRHIA